MAMPNDADRPEISPTLQRAVEVASARHKHLCPRQVLGARAAIAAAMMLQLDLPRAATLRGAPDCCSGGPVDGRIREIEVGFVEQVEELGPEVERHPLVQAECPRNH